MDSDLFDDGASPDELLMEARARITWGESPSEVRAFLTSNGVAAPVADARLKEFVRERNRELRSIGLRSLLIGLALVGLAGAVLAIEIPRAGPWSRTASRVMGLIFLVGGYGLWRLIKGIAYLVRPQDEPGSIPDIEESDPLD
jgi:hypothetical protein